MPKITKGGVSNQYVDPDFISEPGVPVEKALDEGLTDVGQEGVHIGDPRPDGQDVDRDRQEDDEQPKGNEFPAHDDPPKKSTPPAKKTTPAAKK